MDKNLSLIRIGREMSPIINSSVILLMSQRALISRLEARAQCCRIAFVPFQPSGRYSKVSETVKQRAKCVVFLQIHVRFVGIYARNAAPAASSMKNKENEYKVGPLSAIDTKT